MNLFKNLQIKLLAIVSALLLWLFVVGVENYVHVLPDKIPVKVINLGQNVSVANEMPAVKVRYKNESGASVAVNSNELEVYVDAAGLAEGIHGVPVRYISKNPRVNVVAAEPASLQLELEAVVSKEIGLKAAVSGGPARGYEVKNVRLNTELVRISGAAKALASINDMPLKISLDGSESADFSRKITLEAPAEWKLVGKTVTFEPATVQVDIEVRKLPQPADTPSDTANTVKTDTTGDSAAGRPVAEGMQRKNFMAKVLLSEDLKAVAKEVQPLNVLVTVEGKPREIDQLNNNSVRLTIPLAGVLKGVYTVSAKDIQLPQGLNVQIIETSPATVNVKVN